MTETKHGRGPHLTPEKRHAAILESLEPDANRTEIAKKYGISRRAIYGFYHYALDDPKRRLQEAEAEAEFRRKVWEKVR